MKWFVPLECNPEVFNEFMTKLGVEGVEFNDIWSLDEDMLNFIPRPVLAIVLVFPVSKVYEKHRLEQDENAPDYTGGVSPALWAPQTIGNACGTMALLHALANGVPSANLGSAAARRIVSDLKPLNVDSRAEYLENDSELESIHASVASQGDTSAPDATDSIDLHYVCLTNSHGKLVELDGRRKGPIVRGELEGDDIMGPLTISVIREFMDREAGSNNFSIIALVNSN